MVDASKIPKIDQEVTSANNRYEMFKLTPSTRVLDEATENARRKIILYDEYQKSKNQNIQDYLFGHHLLEITADNKFKLNTAEKNRLHAQFPFSALYQELRLFLNEINDLRNGIDVQRSVYDKIDNAVKDVTSEQEKLKAMEQAVLNVYYEIRQKQSYRGSDLGDALERFLKHPDGLNLVSKYDISIPHRVSKNGPAPQLSTLLEKKTKRVALVDIDGTMVIDGRINTELMTKLKKEYDEVILFPGNSDLTIQATPSDELTKNLVAALQGHGIKARVSTMTLQGIVSSIQPENPKQKIEFAIFGNSKENLYEIKKSLDQVKDLNIPKADYYFIQQNQSQKNGASKCFRLKPEEMDDNFVNTKFALDRPSNYKELDAELRKYISERKLDQNIKNAGYHSLFGRITGMSAKKKIHAAQQLLDAIQGNNVSFTHDDMIALKTNRLGKLVAEHQTSWPASFKEAMNQKRAPVNNRKF